jgi:hypothetical protein
MKAKRAALGTRPQKRETRIELIDSNCSTCSRPFKIICTNCGALLCGSCWDQHRAGHAYQPMTLGGLPIAVARKPKKPVKPVPGQLPLFGE